LSCNQLFHMKIIINGTERYLVLNKPHAPRTKSLKPPKITKGRNRHKKPNHVQNGLPHLDMLPNEMPKYDMAHSMEATNGGLEDINTCDCDCRGIPEVGFNDQAPLNGLLEESTMLDDQIDPSYYGTSPHMVTHETNQAPMCPTHETSCFDIEAALMADDIEDNMAIPLEDCQMAMEGFQALDSQSSLEVPRLDDAYIIGHLESLVDNDEVEMPQDYSYVVEMEEATLVDDGIEVPEANAYALELEEALFEDNEAWVIFEGDL
jgi:hypothetical protein